MGTWFWLNMPLAVVFVCWWAGIPLWLTLTRWNAELAAKHAGVTPKAAVAPAASAQLGAGRVRYVVEQPIALLHWFGRPYIRWEIRDDTREALVTLGGAIICWLRFKTHALC
jgi:hypothetical protein